MATLDFPLIYTINSKIIVLVILRALRGAPKRETNDLIFKNFSFLGDDDDPDDEDLGTLAVVGSRRHVPHTLSTG